MSDYDTWIGFERTATDTVSERLADHYRLTLDRMLAGTGDLPGIHWCLAPDAYPPADLGRDGHPKTGLFLPRLPLPRRMWASGEMEIAGSLNAGDTVTRTSTITDVRFKKGRTGDLGFVTVEHDHAVDGATRLHEKQMIVYRDDPDPAFPQPVPPHAAPWRTLCHADIETNTTLLFRYSALTFNGHRIHYDHPYATGVEGYAGLVVHGPLQATWMLNMASDLVGGTLRTFAYRGLSPLICGAPAIVEAREAETGLELRVRNGETNVVTMQASAT
ncbi:3-methylfumaryl-CoA hydratase [Breoghania corrubedonensis]|uniref:3-methylfumaryl-CoA hydratase n=1 Tax=Breoghania corrubedonensis TaxID=665038 RepID=A0A2T5VBC0_9HYPH|nr:MaoC family dehydratase N-terminal domain-containing protein [Breoghania corrubedonensis]PTW61041.1 3-methylfumaryl-CoA hydratase [Breoghania corrubedonensis]